MTEKDDMAEREALRKALIEGEESGVVGPLDMERIKREARDRVGIDRGPEAQLPIVGVIVFRFRGEAFEQRLIECNR